MEADGEYDKYGLLLRPVAPAWGRLPVLADLNSMGTDLNVMLSRETSEVINKTGQSRRKRKGTHFGSDEVSQPESVPKDIDLTQQTNRRNGLPVRFRRIGGDEVPQADSVSTQILSDPETAPTRETTPIRENTATRDDTPIRETAATREVTPVREIGSAVEIAPTPQTTPIQETTTALEATRTPQAASISHRKKSSATRSNSQALLRGDDDDDNNQYKKRRIQKGSRVQRSVQGPEYPADLKANLQPILRNTYATQDSDESMFTIDRIDSRDGRNWPKIFDAREGFSFKNKEDVAVLNNWRGSVYQYWYGKANRKICPRYSSWVVPEMEHLEQLLLAEAESLKEGEGKNRIRWAGIVKDFNTHFKGKIITAGTPYVTSDETLVNRTKPGNKGPDCVEKDYILKARTKGSLWGMTKKIPRLIEAANAIRNSGSVASGHDNQKAPTQVQTGTEEEDIMEGSEAEDALEKDIMLDEGGE